MSAKGGKTVSETRCRNYLQDDSVLMQLILNEYLEACKAFKSSLRLLKKELKKRQWDSFDMNRIIAVISPAVTALAGTAKRILFPIPWKNQLGHLEKLEDYCYLLVLHSEGNNPTFFTLHQEAQGARVMAKQMMRLIQLWDCQASFFLETFDHSHVQDTLEELCDRMKNFADALSVALQFSVKTENVILYFLKNHQTLSNYVGRRFMRDTLSKMFPEGAKKGKKKIEETISSKGFEHLKKEIPSILAKL